MNRRNLTATVVSFLLLGGLGSAAYGAELLAEKTKNLSLAGSVLATTSWLADGNPDTICIRITPDPEFPNTTISAVEVRKATPRGEGTLDNPSPGGSTTFCVDVGYTGIKVKTVHLKAILSTGEGIGVNVRY